jgi:hypothetical protein
MTFSMIRRVRTRGRICTAHQDTYLISTVDALGEVPLQRTDLSIRSKRETNAHLIDDTRQRDKLTLGFNSTLYHDSIGGALPADAAASRSLCSLLRFTSQLNTRAVLTSITAPAVLNFIIHEKGSDKGPVICSRRNSRSSIVVLRLVCATVSLDLRRAIAEGSVYESITFAYTAVSGMRVREGAGRHTPSQR